ncbi:splicing factor 3B subunit 1, putative [Theileria equi strain WA]|uniref:Splicing factor 3B subunit 1, putative n=1 Tax=Theileria equi strain WA TaxID=1537102 RepID=L1LAV9_THEEQ|nr:splicing factor 3B subunit 1, putative [Theileria equi strain WA]EKX72597.1 splicing factor 3B subunit 1, putative [Theileria equi strain WA]|eukprot:XP_004832049.1 splicing factor 3B subunit 1, putative [Theileria equi strain WA]
MGSEDTSRDPSEMEDDYMGNKKSIYAREDDYRRQRLKAKLSPERFDPFSDKTPGPEVRTYADIMKEAEIERQRAEISRHIAKHGMSEEVSAVVSKRRTSKFSSEDRWSSDDVPETPTPLNGATPGYGETPMYGETPGPEKKRMSRWDKTPQMEAMTPGATPMGLEGLTRMDEPEIKKRDENEEKERFCNYKIYKHKLPEGGEWSPTTYELKAINHGNNKQGGFSQVGFKDHKTVEVLYWLSDKHNSFPLIIGLGTSNLTYYKRKNDTSNRWESVERVVYPATLSDYERVLGELNEKFKNLVIIQLQAEADKGYCGHPSVKQGEPPPKDCGSESVNIPTVQVTCSDYNKGFDKYTHTFGPGSPMRVLSAVYGSNVYSLGKRDISKQYQEVNVYYSSTDRDRIKPLVIGLVPFSGVQYEYYTFENTLNRANGITKTNITSHLDKQNCTQNNIVVANLSNRGRYCCGMNGHNKIQVFPNANHVPAGYASYIHLPNGATFNVHRFTDGSNTHTFPNLSGRITGIYAYFCGNDLSKPLLLYVNQGSGSSWLRTVGRSDTWVDTGLSSLKSHAPSSSGITDSIKQELNKICKELRIVGCPHASDTSTTAGHGSPSGGRGSGGSSGSRGGSRRGGPSGAQGPKADEDGEKETTKKQELVDQPEGGQEESGSRQDGVGPPGEKGDRGPKGPDGTPGQKGEDGGGGENNEDGDEVEEEDTAGIGPSSASQQDIGKKIAEFFKTHAAEIGGGALGGFVALGTVVGLVKKFWGYGISTPLTPQITIPESMLKFKIQMGVGDRNRYMTDDELDELLPVEGYEIVQPPPDYTPYRRATSAFAPAATPVFTIQEDARKPYDIPGTPSLLQDVEIKAEDQHFFGKLFDDATEEDLTADEITNRRILALLLKVKNGTPQLRRQALRLLTSKARDFGAKALFEAILPLMMSSSLEDQERHLMVKVIDRILYKLEDSVRPHVRNILTVIEPLLIDEDYYARVEGREIISNLTKAAGLATMIGTLRPDIDHADEYVRNTTARAFAVVASAVGIPSLILFLKAVCQSKKSWQARHTGIKIVQQTAILVGCAVLPHLRQLVEIIAHGLQDEQQKVRTITALALAALAEASAPYGIEAFDCVLRPLWKGITEHKGKGLAAFLKAIGMIIPLMDPYYANYYTREVMLILVNEFSTPDEEMKAIVLKVVRQCVATEGVTPDYIKSDILGPFFQKFWIVRNSLDTKNSELLVETTVEIASKVGASEVLNRLVEDLKDPSEPFRRMVAQAIEAVLIQAIRPTDEREGSNTAILEIEQRLEEMLVDGMLYAFQEQASDDSGALLDSFGTLVHVLGLRVRPYLPQITGLVRWRLGTQSARTRQQAADLIAKIAGVMKLCGEEQMLGHLGLYLYEYLGEEYPEVLGSILGALKAIVSVVGMTQMTPPIKDLLPRLTPILKNRHEKVQENVIELIGRIADRGGDLVSPKEWDRICFDLLDLLKANKKSIRRATVNTFGYIARTIGPHDVLSTLLNHLKVQERQLRICTTIAIAIVAETCLPYSVLPAMMNEYRVPDQNVQTGILKALCFMFEYIGEMAKDYIYAITPLLEDALMCRDLVHRQTAAWTCKHLALGVFGLNCEDALIHLLNYVWPNVFETSPHLTQSVFDAIDGFRVSLGPAILFNYTVQGLFHPARKVREAYWRVYNNLYIGHQDAMVPLYPLIKEGVEQRHQAEELLYML